ncbi:hypothetical protein XA68_13789 [Ophiocordyceps unilateralis]|uniref:Uncharacterized protein n=1 Tax=Ophiocordyceps unilateralis TaxID=268505 RepID=A0A2A9PU47_OPHUN|nr:hypothetical protein XA68_13789 [Ophiocordyceps unilateralis]
MEWSAGLLHTDNSFPYRSPSRPPGTGSCPALKCLYTRGSAASYMGASTRRENRGAKLSSLNLSNAPPQVQLPHLRTFPCVSSSAESLAVVDRPRRRRPAVELLEGLSTNLFLVSITTRAKVRGHRGCY